MGKIFETTWKRNLFFFFFLILLFAVDQVTKYLAVTHLKRTPGISVISGVFELQYLENFGAAFGIMQNQTIILVIVTITILVFFCYIFFKMPLSGHFASLYIILILLASGALGNMFDRIRNGYVVDFFYFSLIDFPIFNVADCYVVISVFLFAFLFLFYYKDEDAELLKQTIFSKKKEGDFQKEQPKEEKTGEKNNGERR